MTRLPLGAIVGAHHLTLALVGPVAAAAPSNDDIATPTAITLPSTTAQSTVEATSGPTDPADCGAGGPTVWFSYTAAVDGQLQIQTFGSDFDTVLVLGTSGWGWWNQRARLQRRRGKPAVGRSIRRRCRNDLPDHGGQLRRQRRRQSQSSTSMSCHRR